MKIIFLGTNGWYSSPTGDTACILIDSKEHYVILDAGSGFYKLNKYISAKKPISLFISHFHLDHVQGLNTLPIFNFEQGIDLYVGNGRLEDFERFVNPPFITGSEPKAEIIANLKTKIRLHELSGEEQMIPFKVRAIEQKHSYIDHGFRMILDGKTIVYTGDCGLTDAARELAQDADLLISECANKKTEHPDNSGHLDPVQAATLAKESNVKQLILTHFAANLYTSLKDRKWAEEEAKKIFPQTTATTDGMEFVL